ncbi:MAG: homoaconitate hydratase [Chloroflexota bacterium]
MSKVWKFGSDIDTDQIVPGRYAPYMRPNDDVGNAAFIEAHPDFNKNAQPGDIIVATDNFGCGSSREYAPLALKRRQIGGIIANSFARIFFRNAINLGIPLYVAPNVVAALGQGDEVTLIFEDNLLLTATGSYALPALPDFARETIAAGGIVRFVRENGRFPGES